jgi:hypothetical protein
VLHNPLAKWAGPCEAMQSVYKRFKVEFGESLTYHQVTTCEIYKDLGAIGRN